MGTFSTIQVPGIVLPTAAPLGTETETVADLVEHTSLEIPVSYLRDKIFGIVAIEAVVVGVPGNLQCWVELSPFPSLNSNYWPSPLPATATYWAAIGGGGGALAPVAPVIEAATGVNATVHTILIPWAIHSGWARLVVQTPVAGAPATAFWVVQAIFSGAGG